MLPARSPAPLLAMNTTETREQLDARWERERLARARRDALNVATLALALQVGFPTAAADPDGYAGADPGHAAGFTVLVGGSRSRLWHLDRNCDRAPAGSRSWFSAPAPELARFVYECAKRDPCPTCALHPVLALAVRVATDASVLPLHGETPGTVTQEIVTCSKGERADHHRCVHCARLAAAAATVAAPVHRDPDGFTVAAPPLVWGLSWPVTRTFAVHHRPTTVTTELGRDGLAAAWSLREGAPSRLVKRHRNEWGTFSTTGSPAWVPASLIVAPGT